MNDGFDFIKMTQTRYGSEDGFVTRRFIEGKVYRIVGSLASYFKWINAAVDATKQEIMQAKLDNWQKGSEVIDAIVEQNKIAAEAVI